MLREARRPRASRATGELVPPYIPHDGWLTEVGLTELIEPTPALILPPTPTPNPAITPTPHPHLHTELPPPPSPPHPKTPTRAPAPPGSRQVELQLRQGRHHQIRRLCQRAGLRLLHLRRLSVGPIALDGMAPGEVREQQSVSQ